MHVVAVRELGSRGEVNLHVEEGGPIEKAVVAMLEAQTALLMAERQLREDQGCLYRSLAARAEHEEDLTKEQVVEELRLLKDGDVQRLSLERRKSELKNAIARNDAQASQASTRASSGRPPQRGGGHRTEDRKGVPMRNAQPEAGAGTTPFNPPKGLPDRSPSTT